MEKNTPGINSQNVFVKECMTDALLLLMEHKSYDSITVTDITKKAGVSRMAFYRNYEVKDDIIDSYFHKKLSQLIEHFSQQIHSHDENLMDLLDLLRSSRPVLRALIASNADYLITRNYEAIIQHLILDHYRIYHPGSVPSGYQLTFLVGGLLHVILAWARQEVPTSDSALEELFLNLEFFIQPPNP